MLKDKLNSKKSIGVALAIFICAGTLLTSTNVKGMSETGKMEPLNQRAYIAVECIDEETGDDIVPIKLYGTPISNPYENVNNMGYGEFIINTKDFNIDGYSLDRQQVYDKYYHNILGDDWLEMSVNSDYTISNPGRIFLMYTKKGHSPVQVPSLPLGS